MSVPSLDSRLRLLATLCDRLADTLRDVAAVLRVPEDSALPPYLVDECATATTGVEWYDPGAAGPVMAKAPETR